MSAELNLVPFIDLLCSIITFLLATAVWSQTEVIEVEQSIGNPPSDGQIDDTMPPLTLHLRADGVWLGRSVAAGENHPRTGVTYDWEAVDAGLAADHDAWPDASRIVIVTDDGVAYEHLIHALDLSRARGYSDTTLGGGSAAPTPG